MWRFAAPSANALTACTTRFSLRFAVSRATPTIPLPGGTLRRASSGSCPSFGGLTELKAAAHRVDWLVREGPEARGRLAESNQPAGDAISFVPPLRNNSEKKRPRKIAGP